MNMFIIIILSLILMNFPPSFSETNSIPITLSSNMDKVEFDGKWSFPPEWKSSTLESFGSNKIRIAHQDDFIYVMINVLTDSTFNKGSDKAMICFDTNNDKSLIPTMNDYCFIAVLNGVTPFTLQGGSGFAFTSYYEKTINHDDFVAVGTMSDTNDRYSKTPHATYEFRIPTDVVGRNNIYGFYVEVFDASTSQTFTWPENIEKSINVKIPPSNLWGEIISIDKSLPEFPLPIFIFSILILTMIILSKKLNYGRLRINIH